MWQLQDPSDSCCGPTRSPPPHPPPQHPTEGSLITQLSLLLRSAWRSSNSVATSRKTVGRCRTRWQHFYFLMTSAVLGLVNLPASPPAGSCGSSISLAKEKAEGTKVIAELKLKLMNRLLFECPVILAALCTCERIKILESLFSIFICYQFVLTGSPQSLALRNNFYANVTYLALHFLIFISFFFFFGIRLPHEQIIFPPTSI